MPGPSPGQNPSTNLSRYSEADELFDALPVPAILNAPDWRILRFNRQAEELLGWSADDVLGRDGIDLLMVDVSPPALAAAVGQIDSGQPWTGEFEVWRADGTTIPVLARLQAVSGEAGQIVARISVLVDLSDRAQLQDHLQLMESALDHAQDGVLISERTGLSEGYSIIYANAAMEAITGYRPAELIGRSPTMLHGPLTDLSEIDDAAERIERGEPVAVEVSVQRKDGTSTWLEVRATPIAGAGGGVPLLLGIHHEITGRRAEDIRFRALIRHAADVVGILDADGTTRFVSPAVEQILGRAPEELVGRSFFDCLEPAERDEARDTFSKITMAPGGIHRDQVRVRHRDGSFRWVEVTVTNLVHDGFIDGLVVNGRDVTERRWADELLAGEARALELIAEGAPTSLIFDALAKTADSMLGEPRPAALAVADGDQMEWLASRLLPDGFLDELGPLPVLVPGQEFRFVASVEEEPAWADRVDLTRRLGIAAIWIIPVTMRTSGQHLGALVVFCPDPSEPEERHRQLFRRFADLAGIAISRARTREALTRRALHDPLTELPNRTLFSDRLGQALARLRREPATVAVLFLDLDRFKVVNDSLGHEAGDQLLTTVADRLLAVLRPGDTAARFGGDEFTLLCEGLTGAEDAVAIAERVAEAVREPIEVGDTEVVVTTSVGIALTSDHTTAADGLLRDADSAMYRAKENGRARLELFDEAMRQRAVARLATETALRRAVERHELHLLYQPEIDIRTGKVKAMEAFLRWRHPERGELTPRDFLPLAEETGLIVPVGGWALREACRQAAEWWRLTEYRADPEEEQWVPRLTIRVNVSGRQLTQDGIVELVEEALVTTGLAPVALCLDVTESALMHDTTGIAANLQQLRSLGVRLAVDDFGTGYSSLSYLKRFPVDALKIDHSFVVGLDADPEDSAIVKAVIGLAHAIGVEAIAESVETADQLAALTELGCDSAQGSLFSAPAPAEVVQQRFLAR